MTPERKEEIKRIIESGRQVHLSREDVSGLLAALEEAEQQAKGWKEVSVKQTNELVEAQQTIARQQAKIDAALSWTWNCSEANMLEVIAALKGDQP